MHLGYLIAIGTFRINLVHFYGFGIMDQENLATLRRNRFLFLFIFASLLSLIPRALLLPVRVARFFLIHYTKMYQKWPQHT
jgi:hypothetical protein